MTSVAKDESLPNDSGTSDDPHSRLPPPTKSASTVSCDHCGLPAHRPGTNEDGDEGLAFCCHGCRGAYELIRGWGLDDYYELRDGADVAVDVDVADQSFLDLDQADLMGRSAPTLLTTSDDRQWLKSRLCVDGLHCAACLWLLEKAPERVEGWQSSAVRMHERSIEIVFDPTVIRLSRIATVLASLGYTLSPLPDADESEQARLNESRRLLVDIAVAGFCAANAMWLAIALYAGSFSGIESGHATVFRVGGVVLGCLAVIFPGRVFFRGAIASLVTRTPHMDLPVAVGLTAGVLGSLYGLMDSSRDVYFDSIAALVFFLLVGRWLQMRQQRRAGEEVAGLIQMSPLAANRLDSSGSVTRVSVDRLQIGDLVRVAPGENIPIDGVIEDGRSTVDRSLLTGESRPISIDAGDVVEAGTGNTESTVTVRATAVGSNTRFAQLKQAVADAAESRTPIVQLANRIGGWFVVVVLGLAVVAGVLAWRTDPSDAISRVVALLIVACPCALALATPLAIAVAIGRLASKRVLVRSGECLERLTRPGVIFFDKTGTLTEGKTRVVQFAGDQETLAIAAAIESQTTHPIAAAIVDYAGAQQELQASGEHDVVEAVVVPGRGVHAQLDDGADVWIGNSRVVTEATSSMSASLEMDEVPGASDLFVVINGEVRGRFQVSDAIRDDAPETIEWLKKHGWRVGILSGDDPRTVEHVADHLRVERDSALGGLLPEEKLTCIRDATSEGPVVMVGDGLNDAAALAAADVGIAIRGGVSASLAAAPIIIGDRRLSQIIRLIKSSRATRRVIIGNFLVSISYNALAVTLALFGLISPLFAAILMPISSLSVILLTLGRRTVSESVA